MLNKPLTQTMSSMFKTEGAVSFFKGITSPLYNVPIIYSCYFGTYEIGRALQGIPYHQTMKMNEVILAAGFSGFVSTIATTPIELIKIKLQMEGVGV